ncbi:hypothetical protein I7I48_08955 [Histoplasma ohiense]|nr:hypothetical protein I7I48_08955 [Histoplasma ohiense (nom. inval.)]
MYISRKYSWRLIIVERKTSPASYHLLHFLVIILCLCERVFFLAFHQKKDNIPSSFSSGSTHPL